MPEIPVVPIVSAVFDVDKLGDLFYLLGLSAITGVNTSVARLPVYDFAYKSGVYGTRLSWTNLVTHEGHTWLCS